MVKRFNIHEWKAKQRLVEQDNFIPDLEDDELKRSKIQQMMAKEKDLQQSDYLSDVEPKIEGSQRAALEELANMYSLAEILDTLEDFYAKNDELAAADYAGEFAAKFRKWMDSRDGGEEDEKFMGDWGPHLAEDKENIPELSDEEKDKLHDMVIEFARKLTDLRGGNYSGDKLLAALQHVTLEIENLEPMIYDDENEDGIPDKLENDEELDEQNVTGGGTSINTGDGPQYGTPNAFAKKGKWNNKKMKVWEEEETEEEPEEELEKDVEKISNLPVLDKVNTRPEWEDMMQVAWDMADDIKTVQNTHKKQWLQMTLKDLSKI